MFSDALKQVGEYTFPVILFRLLENGSVQTGIATFIVVNPEGWIATAGHVIQDMRRLNDDTQNIQRYQDEVKLINDDPSLPMKSKRKRLGRLHRNPEWIVRQTVFWGGFGEVLPASITVDPVADLAIAKIDNFNPTAIKEYPVFKNPSEEMLTGTSLCRLGFPFYSVAASFDQATGQFAFAPNVFPIPRFPNDGIHTRVGLNHAPDGSRIEEFIETSTPGLRGQSGGPIFDRNGHVWAIQSHTQTLEMGITPVVKIGNSKEVVEHQFMHVGWGSSVKNVIRLLRLQNASFTLSS